MMMTPSLFRRFRPPRKSAVVVVSWVLLTAVLLNVQLGEAVGASYLPWKPWSVMGPQRTIVLLVEFQDVKHQTAPQFLDEKIAAMNEYYKASSYGVMSVEADIVDHWESLPQKARYYGAATYGSGDVNYEQFLFDAITVWKPKVDFSRYDYLVTVFAGPSERVADDPDLLATGVPGYYVSPGHVEKPFQIFVPGGERYYWGWAVLSELDPIGVFVHEFGHVLGLPDLYDIAYVDWFVGYWSLMEAGEWLPNKTGLGPSDLDAWSKIHLGWLGYETVTPSQLADGVKLTIYSLDQREGLRAVKIPLSEDTYYLIESRRRSGLDVNLPNEGVIVSFVNSSAPHGRGPVRVVNSHPSMPRLFNASFQVGEVFSDFQNNVFMAVLSKEGSSYTIEVSARLPIALSLTAPAEVDSASPFALRLRATRSWDARGQPYLPLRISVDGKLHGGTVTDTEGRANYTLRLDGDGVHTIEVSVAGDGNYRTSAEFAKVSVRSSLFTYVGAAAVGIVILSGLVLLLLRRAKHRSPSPVLRR